MAAILGRSIATLQQAERFNVIANQGVAYMDALQQLTDQLIAFRDARDWKQFHSLKNLIVSLNLEAAELLELTQWKSDAEVEALPSNPATALALQEECADILLYLLLISNTAGFDLAEAARLKISKNAKKYPVDKVFGSSTKYTYLE